MTVSATGVGEGWCEVSPRYVKPAMSSFVHAMSQLSRACCSDWQEREWCHPSHPENVASFLSWTLGWPSHRQDLWSQSKCFFCCVTREPIICVFLCIHALGLYFIIRNLTLILITIYILSACAVIQNNLLFFSYSFFSPQLWTAQSLGMWRTVWDRSCPAGLIATASRLQSLTYAIQDTTCWALALWHARAMAPGIDRCPSVSVSLLLVFCNIYITYNIIIISINL